MSKSYYRETLADLRVKLAGLHEEEEQARFQHQEVLLRLERTRQLVKMLEEEMAGVVEEQLPLSGTDTSEVAQDQGTLTDRIIEAVRNTPGLQSGGIADLFPGKHRKTVLTRIGQLVTARRLIKDSQLQRLFVPTMAVVREADGDHRGTEVA